MGPSGLLDNDLHALWALRPCDPRKEDIFLKFFLYFFVFFFFRFLFQKLLSYFSGRFATSGYILPLSVPEIEGGGTLSVTEEEKKKDSSCSILGV